MERSAAGKPYIKALHRFPKHKEEINSLLSKYCEVISLFPYKAGRYGLEEEDFFYTLVLICMEADQASSNLKAFQQLACQQIRTELQNRQRETSKLYNPHKNLYLDKCYGDSKIPLGEWMNFGNDEDK